MTNVMIAVRCHGERHGWWHPELGMWLLRLANEPRYNVTVGWVMGAPNAAAAANLAARDFLATPGMDWLGIVDNDVAPPPDMLRILDETDDTIDAIGPISHMFNGKEVLVQQGTGGWNEPFVPLRADGAGHREVDRLGGGCWFMRRRIFDRLERPYFVEMFHPETHKLMISDDVYFQHHAQAAGARLICDTRFVCRHHHSMDLSQLAQAGNALPA